MAQPSVACYFNTRKRSAHEDIKINRVKKVLVLDPSDSSGPREDGLEIVGLEKEKNQHADFLEKKIGKLQEKEEVSVIANKIVTSTTEKHRSVSRKVLTAKSRIMKNCSNSKDIKELLSNMGKNKDDVKEMIQKTVIDTIDEKINEIERHVTPPSTPKKTINALDKVKEKPDGPSLKELRRKMTRSSRLAELKASISRFQENDRKLKEVEKKTKLIPPSPKLKSFKTIELEVQTSPQKVFSPDKSYLSPKKDRSARRNLLPQLSPTKNACTPFFESPSKHILHDISKPALTLPFKYRYLAEMFRSVDVVCQILFNRKETITFRKVKPAVEEMLKKNMLEKHLAQIQSVYTGAFTFSQEKLKVFGTGMKQEQWELVITPKIDSDHINSDILLQRRRQFFSNLMDKVKIYHEEFLATLDPPMIVSKDQIKRWHPEFDIELVPDIEASELPQPPAEETFTSGKDVLEKARQMFNCNTRMEQALQKLKEARDAGVVKVPEVETKVMPSSVLKGIPKVLLDKVRQKQAAKALVSMTRTADKEKEVQIYSRLPEIARLTRNIFVSEKKGVLTLDIVVEKLGNCYRTNLSKTEIEDHLKVISKELPTWLVFHNIRHCMYLKLNKNADLSVVLNKLECLAKQKSEM